MSLGAKWRRRLQGAVTVVVWLMALGGAVYLYQQVKRAPRGVMGFAEERTVAVSHLEGGRISRIHVDLFDQVHEGQILVQLDPTPARDALEQVETQVARLRSEIEASRERISWENLQEEAAIKRTHLDQQSEQRARLDLARRLMVDRENAQLAHIGLLSDLARDRMLLQGARVRFEAVERLAQDGMDSIVSLSDARTEVRALEAVIEQRTKSVELAQTIFEEADRRWFLFTRQEEQANEDSEELRVDWSPLRSEAQLAPLRLAIDAEQAKLEALVRKIDALVLRAAIDGQVTRLLASSGEVAQAGQTLMTIGSEGTGRVVAYLLESSSGATMEWSPGALVEVRNQSGSEPLVGNVLALSSHIEEAPRRYRTVANQPLWGRPILIELETERVLSPGEKVWVQAIPSR